MSLNIWLLVIGAVLIFMALSASILKRLPLTTSIVYLSLGFILGPAVLNAVNINPLSEAGLLERLTELALLFSLFTTGLKLRVPLSDSRWILPIRLAFGSMLITVGLISLVGVVGLGLPLGAAVLLGGILAPTDPVLASDVQVEHAWDRDRLRFSLTGEAGLNDGTSTPFVLLGLGLLGLQEMGEFGWRWLAVNVVWGVSGGLLIGWAAGTLVGRLVVYLRREHKEAVGLDDFLALGLVALTYSVAMLFQTYGFLAVFAAGLALRRIERMSSGERPAEEVQAMTSEGQAEEIATDPEKAPAYMAQAVLGFNEQLERICEVGLVLVLGIMLSSNLYGLPGEALWFVPLLFVVIRPVSVELGLLGSHTSGVQRRLIDWFGIRGIGSMYYLVFAIGRGLPPELAQRLSSLVLIIIAVSIVIHGVSVTPLMNLYGLRRKKEKEQRQAAESQGLPLER